MMRKSRTRGIWKGYKKDNDRDYKYIESQTDSFDTM